MIQRQTNNIIQRTPDFGPFCSMDMFTEWILDILYDSASVSSKEMFAMLLESDPVAKVQFDFHQTIRERRMFTTRKEHELHYQITLRDLRPKINEILFLAMESKPLD